MKMKKLLLAMLMLLLALCLTGCGGSKQEEHPDFDYAFNDTNEYARVLRYKGESPEVTFPETLGGKPVKEIMATTFAQTPHVTAITIGAAINKIEDPSFSTLPNLTTLTVDGENGSFAVVDGVLFHKKMKTVYCYPQGKAGDSYTLPDSVTTVGDSAFRNTKLKQITLSPDVSKIYASAFADNALLESVTFGGKVKQIYESAFKNCPRLTGVELPKSTTSVAANCFEGCTSLTEIILPDKVTSIGGGAFKGCTGLTSVTVQGNASSLQRIAEETFAGCTSLTAVRYSVELLGIADRDFLDCAALSEISTLSDKLSVLGEAAFKGCTALADIPLTQSVTQLGAQALDQTAYLAGMDGDFAVTDTGILLAYRGSETDVTVPAGVTLVSRLNDTVTRVVLPEGVTAIAAGAFKDCKDLNEIILPDSLTAIGAGAFAGCTGLETITLPVGLSNLGVGAFEGCTGMTAFRVAEGNKSFYVDQGVLYDNVTMYLTAYPLGSSMTAYTIPFGVKFISPSAFRGAKNLESVDATAAEELTKIGEYAFADCEKLKSVKFHEEFRVVGDYAFMNCVSLADYAVNYKMTEIGKGAFMGCRALKSLELAQPIAKIGEDAFTDTTVQLTVYQGTYAESYAKGRALNVKTK